MKNYSDQDYYWAKAEFQDQLEHRCHVDSYKRGFPDDYYFHDRYRDEAINELYEEYKQKYSECHVSFEEFYSNEYKENGGVL